MAEKDPEDTIPAPSASDGSGVGLPTLADGSAATGVNLLRAIHIALKAQATPPAAKLPEKDGIGCSGSGLVPPGGAPGGGNPVPAAQANSGSGAVASGPSLVRKNHHRRVFSDDKRLSANRAPNPTGRVRALTSPKTGTMKSLVTKKLAALAAAGGIKKLPGTGTLTLAVRKIDGGRDQVIQYLRMAAADGDPHAEVFLHVWDDLKGWERKLATLDDVCAAAGVAPVKIVKCIVGTAYESNCDVANLVAAHAHPDVVKFTTKMATTADGVEDRKMLLQHAGFLPAAKGQVINIGVSATANAAALNSGGDSSVPDFLDDMEELMEAKDQVQQHLIAESTSTPLVLDQVPDAELVD